MQALPQPHAHHKPSPPCPQELNVTGVSPQQLREPWCGRSAELLIALQPPVSISRVPADAPWAQQCCVAKTCSTHSKFRKGLCASSSIFFF